MPLEGDFKAERSLRAGFDPTTGVQQPEPPEHYLLAEFAPSVSSAHAGRRKQWKGLGAALWFDSGAALRTPPSSGRAAPRKSV